MLFVAIPRNVQKFKVVANCFKDTIILPSTVLKKTLILSQESETMKKILLSLGTTGLLGRPPSLKRSERRCLLLAYSMLLHCSSVQSHYPMTVTSNIHMYLLYIYIMKNICQSDNFLIVMPPPGKDTDCPKRYLSLIMSYILVFVPVP